jgi:hypothetical protein
MSVATTRGFRRLPALERLDRKLTREWDFQADPSGAVATARAMMGILVLRASKLDLARHFWCISHAAEVLWDSQELDDAVRLTELWRQAVISICDERELDPTEARIWAAILSARVEHRRRRYDDAVIYAHTALAEIQELTGGRKGIEELLARGAADPVSEMYCAALAIAIPAGRMRFSGHPVWRAQYLDRWISEALLLLDRDAPPKLIRIHALVIQTFYALCEEDQSIDNQMWLDRLERFDDLVRPRTARGQATRPLRSVARAGHEGDDDRSKLEAEKARKKLANLPRHIEVLTANRWWPSPSPTGS